MTRPRSKRVDREGPIQQAIVEYLRAVLPSDCVVHHGRNEINKSGWRVAKEIAQARRRGTVKGWPDIIVLTYQGALFFEVKAPGNYASADQRDLHERLMALGYPCAVVRSIDETRACLRAWNIGHCEVSK